MSATSVWDAPSGECLRGRGRYGESLQVTLYDPYLSASEVVFHEEALYQVYLPLPLPLLVFQLLHNTGVLMA